MKKSEIHWQRKVEPRPAIVAGSKDGFPPAGPPTDLAAYRHLVTRLHFTIHFSIAHGFI